jgi:hypothetical protein
MKRNTPSYQEVLDWAVKLSCVSLWLAVGLNYLNAPTFWYMVLVGANAQAWWKIIVFAIYRMFFRLSRN